MVDVVWVVALVASALVGVAVLALSSRLTARLAGRNLARRRRRAAIIVLGLLVGTAIISSSLVVGDTLKYVFLEDAYTRLGAVDETVADSLNGNLYPFDASLYPQLRAALGSRGSPIDGIAPTLILVMPVRNELGNKGNQQITVIGIDDSLEAGFGGLTNRNGTAVALGDLPAPAAVLN